LEEITPTQAMILGKINYIYLADEIAQEDEGRLNIDAEAIDPIARLGGNLYSLMGGTTDIPRPK